VARFLLICLGGAIGTGARYMIAVWMARTVGTGFPYGTLLINAVGSFLLGLLMQLSLSTEMISADMRLIIGTESSADSPPTRRSITKRSLCSVRMRGAWRS